MFYNGAPHSVSRICLGRVSGSRGNIPFLGSSPGQNRSSLWPCSVLLGPCEVSTNMKQPAELSSMFGESQGPEHTHIGIMMGTLLFPKSYLQGSDCGSQTCSGQYYPKPCR